jgi:hypothetical protein
MINFKVGEQSGLDEVFSVMQYDAHQRAYFILDLVGLRTVEFLRSLTNSMQPPVGRKTYRTKTGRKRFGAEGARKFRPGQGNPRPAHPGGWADVTGALAAGYQYTVEITTDGAELILANPVEYAAALEARDGYFVLSGVADPGGPVEQEIRRLVAQLAPEWEVRDG